MDAVSVNIDGILITEPEKLIVALYQAVGDERILDTMVREGLRFRRGRVFVDDVEARYTFVVTECTSTDPTDHEGDTCPIHESEQCRATTSSGFACVLPKGHNMGNADVPENHSDGVE